MCIVSCTFTFKLKPLGKYIIQHNEKSLDSSLCISYVSEEITGLKYIEKMFNFYDLATKNLLKFNNELII